jgi:ribosome-associated toxin RatA of RatAB toxin-antitoxin module
MLIKFYLKILFILVFTKTSFANSLDSIIIDDNLESDKSGSVRMVFWVKSNPNNVWNLLTNYDNWTKFMDDVDKVTIISRSENQSIIHVKAKTPINMNIYYVLKRTYDKNKYEIKWKMLEGSAKDVEGSWKIVKENNTLSKVIYTNYVDLGFSIPPKITSLLIKSKLPNLANNIKKMLD